MPTGQPGAREPLWDRLVRWRKWRKERARFREQIPEVEKYVQHWKQN